MILCGKLDYANRVTADTRETKLLKDCCTCCSKAFPAGSFDLERDATFDIAFGMHIESNFTTSD